MNRHFDAQTAAFFTGIPVSQVTPFVYIKLIMTLLCVLKFCDGFQYYYLIFWFGNGEKKKKKKKKRYRN